MNLIKKLALLCLGFLFLNIKLSAQTIDNNLSEKEKKDNWKLLFDGKNTSSWKGAFINTFPEKGWKVEDGILMVEPSNGSESKNGGDIITKELFSDFHLKVDFKLTQGANSGIKYFVDPHQPVPTNPRSAFGLEYQLLDDERHADAKMGRDGNRTIGSLYDLMTANTNKPVKPIGEWNTAEIISKGKHVEHWLNGIKILEYERGSEEFKKLVTMSKYKDLPGFGLVEKGSILLQDHGNKVYFKNIKIKVLK